MLARSGGLLPARRRVDEYVLGSVSVRVEGCRCLRGRFLSGEFRIVTGQVWGWAMV